MTTLKISGYLEEKYNIKKCEVAQDLYVNNDFKGSTGMY